MNRLLDYLQRWMHHQPLDSYGRATIHRRRIYILPTRFGLVFGVLVLLMLIGALNYDNNPAYLLTFFLAGLGGNAMYFTWRNLKGIQVQVLHTEPVFCGESLKLRLQLTAEDTTERPAIRVSQSQSASMDDLPAQAQPRILQLNLPTQRRGWMAIGRIEVSTDYPLGLFHAWSYLDLHKKLLVYPRPIGPEMSGSGDPQTSGEHLGDQLGHEDFYGLRDYQHGDSPRQIDWKSLARERGVMCKQFTLPQGQIHVIDWYQLPGQDKELKLSQMTYSVLQAESDEVLYSLKLPGLDIEAGRGAAHRHQCLQVLANFGEAV